MLRSTPRSETREEKNTERLICWEFPCEQQGLKMKHWVLLLLALQMPQTGSNNFMMSSLSLPLPTYLVAWLSLWRSEDILLPEAVTCHLVCIFANSCRGAGAGPWPSLNNFKKKRHTLVTFFFSPGSSYYFLLAFTRIVPLGNTVTPTVSLQWFEPIPTMVSYITTHIVFSELWVRPLFWNKPVRRLDQLSKWL